MSGRNRPGPSRGNEVQEIWPALPYAEWADTYATLHMWSQIVGKIRLAQTPWWNHSWHVPLYVTARGLTTSTVPYGPKQFDIEFDFIDHRLVIRVSDGAKRELALQPRTVADFYTKLMRCMQELDLPVKIHETPNEVADPVRFSDDVVHKSYDAEAATRFWKVLLQADRVFKRFQSSFLGKSSPVHFFWGSFDLAVTRFSGRPAPPHPGGVPGLADPIVREAYSHEVSSAGFWPGGAPMPEPIFYSYAYPAPQGFASAKVRPPAATFHEALSEFVLSYETVRKAAAPDEVLLQFLQSTYAAAADLGGWDRVALDCDLGKPGVPRKL